ncbi:hypothetical protein NGA_2068700, partial [Nannochloropsis gaditana CCMP526]|uniref:uncharacterized protein n=1 Tax=Nannochloropsis gaditana (strain CCMP526) TaxID=1093141 RepID=UPI00029F766B
LNHLSLVKVQYFDALSILLFRAPGLCGQIFLHQKMKLALADHQKSDRSWPHTPLPRFPDVQKQRKFEHVPLQGMNYHLP